MKRKINGREHKPLRRKAKKLSKESGIGYMAALDIIAIEAGFPNWKKLCSKAVLTPQPAPVVSRLKASDPSAVDYHDVRRGTVIGKRPNAIMSVRRHAKVGEILKDLLFQTEYHKRAKKPIQDIRIIMDTWLGYEYDGNAMSNAEFNQFYYGGGGLLGQIVPTRRQQESFKRLLRTARAVIDSSYPACKPIDKLHQRFDLALKALDKWPASAKPPVFDNGRINPGTFVRLKFNKKIGLVFHHNIKNQVVEGYSDAGSFHVGRHELTILRAQPSIDDFKPIRLCWPYGRMKCADGSEVLFNRDYNPIWRRSATGEVSPVSPDTSIDYEDREFYYDDRTAPYYNNNETKKRCLSILKNWGIRDQNPEILKLLPAALHARNMSLLSPKGLS